MKYGSPEWLERLPSELTPLGRHHGFIVVRVGRARGLVAKIVGGPPEHPSLIALSPLEAAKFAHPEKQIHEGTPLVGALTMEVTWVDWYNINADPAQQEKFDDVTKRIDALGEDALPGGSSANIIDSYKYTDPSIYPALENYRDTGGRRALFAKSTKAYADKPIAVAAPNGPMEVVNGNITLHPGRYTFSDAMYENPKAGFFKNWLDSVTRDKRAQVLRTQVSEGLLANVPILSVVSRPYYMDYEFLVATDVTWNPDIPGIPTWLPGGIDVQGYWGKPTPSAQADPTALKEAGQGLLDFGKSLATIAVLLGVGYVFLLVGKNQRAAPAPAHA